MVASGLDPMNNSGLCHISEDRKNKGYFKPIIMYELFLLAQLRSLNSDLELNFSYLQWPSGVF